MRLLSLLLLLGLSACSVTGPIGNGGGAAAVGGQSSAMPPSAGASGAAADAAPAGNRASAALLDQSRQARADGELGAAARTLERALAIDPNNPVLWIELAEVRQSEGDRDQADAMARKALTLAGSDRSIAERAERLVSR